MGVKKLQSFMELHTEPEGFHSVSLSELKAQFEKENPGAPVELLLDVECCLRFIYRANLTEFRYGGENVTLLKLLRNFFDKFNGLGIKLVSFYGNYTSKKKRSEWVRRRYETIDKVCKLIQKTESSRFDHSTGDALFVIPPGLCFTSTSIIKHVLKEKVIQSLTENDIEIITYAKKNKSFAIMSQDSDFIIANAAHYYLSIKHLDLDTMSTHLYDGNVLAKMHDLKLNQMPLFATLLGTDLMDYEVLKYFHNTFFFRKKDGKLDLKYFFAQAAIQCQNIECDDNCIPVNESDIYRLIRNIRGRGCNYRAEEVYRMIMDSIQSFQEYQVEEELCFSHLEDENMKETLKLALLLYRQSWITSDLLMLLCAKTTEMSTCMEIFDYDVKPIGIILRNLRATLYSATFNGDTRICVEEFAITGKGCFDRSVPKVWASRTVFVRPLLEVWQSSLEPDTPRPGDYEPSYDPKLQLDNVVFKSKESERDKCKEYFVDLFCQTCSVSPLTKKTLLAKFKTGLPQAAQLPLFIFIYLESDQHAYLHQSERDAVLFTFSTVSVLSLQQVEEFSHPQLERGRNMVPVMRAANLFRRSAQVMINFNAVCGFPIPVQWVDGHNFWQGSFVQMFHAFLYDGNKTQTDLYEVIVEALQKFDDSNVIPRFTNLVQILAELFLLEKDLSETIQSTNSSETVDTNSEVR